MQQKNGDKLTSEILEWTKKLDKIIAECDLMAKKRDKSENTEYIQNIQNKLLDCQSEVIKHIDELNKHLAKARNDVEEKIEETITDHIAETVHEKTIHKLTHKMIAPLKEHTETLDSEIGSIQKGLKNLTEALDTQGRNIFESTLENTTNFINAQKDGVKKKVEQLQETGSIRSNYQQLMDNIEATEENCSELLRNPNKEAFANTMSLLNNACGFFGRYLADKYNETKMVTENGEKIIEKSIEKQGGCLPYAKSLIKKADNTVENQTKKLDRLESFYRFYTNAKEFGQNIIASASCLAADPPDSKTDATNPELSPVELKR